MRIVLLFVTAVTLAVAVVTSSHAARLAIDDRAARSESVAATCAPDPVTVKVMRDGYNPPPPVIPVS